MAPGDDHSATVHRIGPNAILQTMVALDAIEPGSAETVMREAGLAHMLRQPPVAMVDERQVARLFRAVLASLDPAPAIEVFRLSGRLTGEYVLANRIPAAARLLLKALPSFVSAPILAKAISRNAWTFAGSGRLTVESARPAAFRLSGNPIPTPDGVWHCAVFEVLFSALVSAKAHASHEGPTSNDRFLVEW